MKKIGLIGGMSWESSAVYYRLLNEEVGRILGGTHSCDCIMDSVDFAEIERLQHEERWEELCDLMQEKAENLQKAGAEIVLLCTNTMHLCSSSITKNLDATFLHIAQATGEAIVNQGLHRVGLLGTKFTMERDFYAKTLKDSYGIEVLTPNENDRQLIHDCIYQELVRGIFSESSRREFIRIIEDLESQRAQGVVLGCTEIPLLIEQRHVALPVFDTTSIHVKTALKMALGI